MFYPYPNLILVFELILDVILNEKANRRHKKGGPKIETPNDWQRLRIASYALYLDLFKIKYYTRQEQMIYFKTSVLQFLLPY